MDVESKKVSPSAASAAVAHHNRSRKRRTKICIAVLVVILALVLLLVILGFTVFKPKNPTTTVDSVALKDFDFSLNIARLQVLLNITLDVHISVYNPNRIGFKFTNSSAFLNYRGRLVGEAPIPAAKISPQQTVPFNLTLTVLADRLLSTSNLYSDVLSGTLPLSTNTRISGQVYILNLFKIHVVSYTTCDLTINVMNRTVGDKTCHYKTKL